MPGNPDQQARGKSSCGSKPLPTHATGDSYDTRFVWEFRGRELSLFAGNRRRLQGFRQQSLFRSFCGSSNWQGVGCPEFGKNGLAPRAANNVFFPRIHFFGQERALMVRGEHIGFRTMQISGGDAQAAHQEPAQNGVKLFVFFGGHPFISPC